MRVWKRTSTHITFDFFQFSHHRGEKVGNYFSQFGPILAVCNCAPIVVFVIQLGVFLNRVSSWHVDGVGNDNAFLAQIFTKLPFPVILGIGLRESNPSVLSSNSSFSLVVLIVKSYEETSFAKLGAMSVSMAMNGS